MYSGIHILRDALKESCKQKTRARFFEEGKKFDIYDILSLW